MGVDFYVVVPKLRIKIYVGRHISEEDSKDCAEKLNKFIDNNMDGKYDANFDSINYKDITIKDMARLITFHEEIAYLLDDRLISNILVSELLRIFPNAKLVADSSEEYDKYANYTEYPKQ